MTLMSRVFVGVLWIVLLVTAAALSAAPTEAKRTGWIKAGTVAFVKGNVLIRREGEKKAVEAEEQMTVYYGDTVRTGERSSAGLVTSDDTRSSLGAETEMSIPWPDPKNKKKAGPVRTLRLILGKLWVKVVKKGTSFEVRTPSAAAAVKGTEFQVDVDKSNKTVLTVFEGFVNFSNAAQKLMVQASQQCQTGPGKQLLSSLPVDLSTVLTPDMPEDFMKGIIHKQMKDQMDKVIPGGGGIPGGIMKFP